MRHLMILMVVMAALMLFAGVASAHDPDSVTNDDITYGVVCSTLPGAAHGCDEEAGEVVEAHQEGSSEPQGHTEGAVSDGEVLYEAEKTICIKAEANVWLYAIAKATGYADQEGGEDGGGEFDVCRTFTIQVTGGAFALVKAWVVEDEPNE